VEAKFSAIALLALLNRVPKHQELNAVPCYTRLRNFRSLRRKFQFLEGLMKCRVPAALVVCALCALFLLSVVTPAYAYTDPNAVGLASQIITPLLIMLSAAAAFLRKQIAAGFSALSRRLRRDA
jgi:hypothetical protein